MARRPSAGQVSQVDEDVKISQEIGSLLKNNDETIYDTRPVPPYELGHGSLDAIPPAQSHLTLELWCSRSQPRADGPAFDNLIISR